MGLVKPRTARPAAETEAEVDAGPAGLSSPQAGERRRAVAAVAARPGGAADLVAHLRGEAAASVRSAIFAALAERPCPETAEALCGLLAEEDAGLRNSAIEALQAMPEAFEPCVEGLLASEDSDVRILTVNAVALMAHPRAPDWLVEVVETDPHVNVCCAAVDGLAEIGSPEAAPSLRALQGRFPGQPFLDFAVAAALRRMGAG